MATDQSTNTGPTRQLTPTELSALASRLRARANSVLYRDQPHQAADLRTAASLIEQLIQPGDLLVDITDDGKASATRFGVPLREAIGDDEEEYEDCRKTLLADGKCTTGGGAAPLYHLVMVGRSEVTIEMRGGKVAAVTGLPPGTTYVVRHDAGGQ
jgi:hypothetical protein